MNNKGCSLSFDTNKGKKDWGEKKEGLGQKVNGKGRKNIAKHYETSIYADRSPQKSKQEGEKR